jgi:hypothetical protein
MPAEAPAIIPPIIGTAFAFRSLIFLYRGTANITVAGARKKDIICPPLL